MTTTPPPQIGQPHDSDDSPVVSRPPSEKLEEGAEPDFQPSLRLVLAFLSLCVVTLMAALDATSLSVALPKMAAVLHGTAIEAFWAGTSFLLTSTAFQPVIGAFSHIFGRKPLILISLVIFGVGAIVAAVANNFTLVLAGRSVQGIGGGGVIVLTEIIVTDLVPLKERGKWFSFISVCWSLGTVGGPLLGAGFSQNVSWRWIFYINLPFIVLAAPMIIFLINLNYKTSSMAQKLARVDWVGMILFISALTGFLVPISWGGVMYPWSSWRTLVPLIICGFGLTAFVLYEEWFERRGGEPMIRFGPLKTRTGAVTYFGTFLHGILLWSLLYYEPLYYEGVKGYSAILTGVAMFPETFTVAPAAMVTGIVISITGRYRWGIWTGWFLTTLGLGLITLMKVDTSVPAWVFLNLVPGVGMGMLFAAMAIAVQAASTNADMAWAVVLFAFFRALGQTFGVAIGGVIFQNEMEKKLLTYPLLAANATAFSKDASGLVQIIKTMPQSLARSQLLEAYTDSLRYVYIVIAALAGVALVTSFFTEGLDLNRALETEQGFRSRDKSSDEGRKASA